MEDGLGPERQVVGFAGSRGERTVPELTAALSDAERYCPPSVEDPEPACDGLPASTYRRLPADPPAEKALLGAMMRSSIARSVAFDSGLEPDMFYVPRHGIVFEAIRRATDAGDTPDPVVVHGHIPGAGRDEEALLLHLLAFTPSTSGAAAYARRIAETCRARRLAADAYAVSQTARTGDLSAALDAAAKLTHGTIGTASTVGHAQLGPFVDTKDADYDWLIAGLLERTDRVLLTGPEGGGKSTFLRQFAVQAAAGIHPFTLEPVMPMRVLLLDLENGERHVRRALRALRTVADGAADQRLNVAVHAEGLDLTDATDLRALTQLIAQIEPDLVIGGPVYKLVGGDPTEERPAKAAAMALDHLRVGHGFALALETHQPHDTGGKRPERPYGASLWKRWPEFGLHLAQDGQLRHWRGARDERQWPASLTRGAPWPWIAAPTISSANSTSNDWDPVQAASEALRQYFTVRPNEEVASRKLGVGLRDVGHQHDDGAVRAAAAILVREGFLTVRSGPRNARLHSLATDRT
ncbi:MAG TPA: AAA family ATPase [Aquihabitans sp.]|nr:AAA family ATPase [Aquihabitans sp.]